MSRKWMAFLAVFALIPAGCGGSASTHTQTTPVKPPPQTKQTVIGGGNVHACDSANAVMQCFLPAPSITAPLQASPIGQPVFGVDFAWGGPSCATLKSQGRSFGFSYLSTDPAKNWQHSQFLDYLHNGCKTGFVWETSATRAAGGTVAGHADALLALQQYRSYVPAPGRVSIDFAIDFDASGPDVAAYFGALHAVLGAGENAYGGAGPISYLCSKGLVGNHNWSTYAWLFRNGNHFPAVSCAPLQQYLNDTSVDYDRAYAADYGQYPAPGPVPPPPPKIRCFSQGWQHTHFCLNIRAQELHAGAKFKQEEGYLKVSNANLAALRKRYAADQARVNQIDARAKVELAKRLWTALAVSAHNADVIEATLAPALRREAAIQANIKLESARAAAAKKLYEGLLGKYGYTTKGH